MSSAKKQSIGRLTNSNIQTHFQLCMLFQPIEALAPVRILLSDDVFCFVARLIH